MGRTSSIGYDLPVATTDTDVTWRVDELLAERGWTVVRLASTAGLDPKTVRNIVNRRATRADLHTIGRLSGALGVTPGELFSVASRADRWAAWEAFAGGAGRGEPWEYEPGDTVLNNPALERATRP